MKADSLIVEKGTTNDLRAIHRWMHRLEDQGHGTFLCNWNTIYRIYRKHGIYVGRLEGKVIGYILPTLDILEVHRDFRRRGIGRALVEYAEANRLPEYEYAYGIECAPLSSKPFWKAMGYKFFTEERACKEFEKRNFVGCADGDIDITIEFYGEWEKYYEDPYKKYQLKGRRTRAGQLMLDQRVVAYHAHDIWDGDAFLKIQMPNCVIREKAKRPVFAKMGLEFRRNSWVIDTYLYDTV